MAKVNVGAACATYYKELVSRKEELDTLKKQLEAVDKDIQDINLKYVDSLYETRKESILIELQRKDSIRNSIIKRLLTLVGRDDIDYSRNHTHFVMNGDNFRFEESSKPYLRAKDTQVTSEVGRRIFDSEFYLSTPKIIRTIDDEKSLTFGRDSICVYQRFNSLRLSSDGKGSVMFVTPAEKFSEEAKKLLNGEIDTTELPDYIKDLLEGTKQAPKMDILFDPALYNKTYAEYVIKDYDDGIVLIPHRTKK